MALLIQTRKEGGVFIVTLNFAPANCYSHEMMLELDKAILQARFDSSVHVIVIIGAGDKFFCAGADIGMLQEADPGFKYNFCLHANEVLLRLENTQKLVIAAINGHCVGGGLEIALACDMRFAYQNAGKIGLPEVKLGLLPGTGGTVRLTRLLGKAAALEMMVSANLLSFEEALQKGLLTRVISASNLADFQKQIIEYGQNFCPPKAASFAIGQIKRSVQSGQDMSVVEHLSLERELQQRLFESKDAKEGILAYRQKREALFVGS